MKREANIEYILLIAGYRLGVNDEHDLQIYVRAS